MYILIYAIIATVVVSLVSLIGIFTLSIKDKILKKILILLVALSAGAMMGGAFIHLIPEAIEGSSADAVGILVLAGFMLFFIVERLLHWRHCHDGKCEVHMFTYMNLIGDGVHNFIDGIIIVVSFLVSIPFGIVTTLAVLFHEIPQELGDFGVLVHGGFSKAKALTFNFLTALTAVLGAVFGYFLSSYVGNIIPIMLPIAAGGFIYIAASDLVPELHKEPKISKAMFSFVFFLIGIGLMWLVKFLFGG